MTHFEMVERLRAQANVTYEEAKNALEAANWDLLDAMVLLEKEGRVNAGGASASYTTYTEPPKAEKTRGFGDGLRGAIRMIGKLLVGLIERGNRNSLVVNRAGEKVFTLPVTVLVVLIIPCFWCIVPLLIIGLFTGFRYSFSGPDLGREAINNAMNRASDVAEEVKRDIASGHEKKSDEASKDE